MNQAPRFPITGQMPYGVQRLQIQRYTLPLMIGSDEEREAAARLLVLMQEKGGWTGITRREIDTQIKVDAVAFTEKSTATYGYDDLVQQHAKARFWYEFWCIVTLGIYWLAAEKPASPKQPEYRSVPATKVFEAGIGMDFVVNGLDTLIRDGLVEQKTITLDGAIEKVFYPTPALAKAVEAYATQ